MLAFGRIAIGACVLAAILAACGSSSVIGGVNPPNPTPTLTANPA